MEAMTADSPSPAENAVRVFLSYSWDSEEHKARVLVLAERLRDDGVDAWMDRFTSFPPEGWPLWMEREIAKAQFVIVVATEKYAQRFRGDAPEGTGLGATWEGAIITQELYEASGRNKKFLPVVIAAADGAHIPTPLRRYPRFSAETDAGYDTLYRVLTNQPEIIAAPLGKKRHLPAASPTKPAPLPIPIIHNPTAASTLHQLPPPPQDFVGREEDLRQLLALNPAGGALLTGLRGMGGIGKTALALVLAHEWSPRFPDAQFFLDGRGTQADPPSASKLMEKVIQAFLLTVKLPDDEAAVKAIYHEVLRTKKVLILLDNAQDATQAVPLIPPAGCAYIVTSRHNFLLGRTAPHAVGRLPDDQALVLLREHYTALNDSDGAALILLCVGLPLALRLAGAHLALDAAERGGLANVSAYLQALRGSRLATLDAEAADASEVTISETLRLSEAQLPSAEREAWRKLGVFTGSFDARAALAIAAADENTLAHLVRRSLLEREGEERYKLHDLAADYTSGRHSGEAFAALHLVHAKHYTRVGDEADMLYMQGHAVAGLALFDRERAQIEVAFAWLAMQEDQTSAAVLVQLVNSAAYIGQSLRFHPRQRIRWLDAQLSAARLLERRESEGNALGNLGNAYSDLGDIRKAIELHEQALLIDREIGHRRGEGQDLGNLGVSYVRLGDAGKAIEFFEQHRIIAREIGDRRGEGIALGNLGGAYATLGNHRKAIEFHEQALLIDREIGHRQGEGRRLGNLGIAYASLGDHCKAIKFCEERLIIAREIGDRSGEGYALWNSALALDKLGKRVEAITCAESALLIRDALEDPNAAIIRATLEKWRAEGPKKPPAD